MSEPFLGEIRAFGFGFPPQGWALCNGQLLNVNQNAALYSLLGNQFGGSAPSTFALPDLRSRVPMHTSASLQQGSKGGAETVTLTPLQMPLHTHSVLASNLPGDRNGVSATRTLAQVTSGSTAYAAPDTSLGPLNTQAMSNSGGNAGHSNLQPFQVVSFAIALSGLYPPRQ